MRSRYQVRSGPAKLFRDIQEPLFATLINVLLMVALVSYTAGGTALGAEQKYDHDKIARQTLNDHIVPGYRA
ncbi:MAG: hypothetical protein ACR2OW_06065, partial [Methyloligellaceae bacterium]